MEETTMRQELLLAMREGRFPVARFELHNDAEEELVLTALDNVYIRNADDAMELVKARGAALEALEECGLIQIDFTAPVYVVGDHKVYYQSKIYELLCQTALEASHNVQGCLFHLPVLCRGYARLTPLGRRETRHLLACRRMEHLG